MAKVPATPPNPSDTTQLTDPPADDNPPVPDVIPDPNEVIDAYKTQLLAETRARADLERQLRERQAPPPSPPPAPKEPTEEEEKEFFNKPVSTIKRLVRDEVEQSVKGLNAFTAKTAREQTINTVKQHMKNNPDQFPYMGIAGVEEFFDQIIATVPEINGNVAVGAYNTAIGYFVSNGGTLTKTADDKSPPPPNRGNPPVPPRVPPTPPAVPGGGGTKRKLRALTEAEKKIARFNRQNDAEYLFWTEELTNQEVGKLSKEEIDARFKQFVGGA